MSRIVYRIEFDREAFRRDLICWLTYLLFPLIPLPKKRKKAVSDRLNADFETLETAFQGEKNDRRGENLEVLTPESIGEKCRNPKCYKLKKGKSMYCSDKCKSDYWNQINRKP